MLDGGKGDQNAKNGINEHMQLKYSIKVNEQNSALLHLKLKIKTLKTKSIVLNSKRKFRHVQYVKWIIISQ